MKKLCYILPEYNPETDTHFAYLYDFLKLAAEKLDIFLIVEKSAGRKIPGNFKKVYYQKFRFGPWRALELVLILKWARFSGYQSFYTHYSYIGAFFAGVVSFLTGGRSFYWNCASAWNLKRKIRSRFLLWLALKTSQHLVTGTEGLKKEYAARYRLRAESIKVMPNWVDLGRFAEVNFNIVALREKFGVPAGAKILLFVHHLSERKGVDYLLPIMEKLKENCVLLIAGHGPEAIKLAETVEQSDLESKVKLLGAVPNREIAELYALADLFLMPSREEGFPRVLLECMASGLPFVAFDTGGVREISPSAAQEFILPPGEVGAFAGKVGFLLNNSEIYNRFREQEKEKVEEFSKEKVVEIFINQVLS